MAEQQERFDNRDQLDAERNSRRIALSVKIEELTRQLTDAQGEIDTLNKTGSIREQFIAFAKQIESRISGIANATYKFLLEKVSQERHEASYSQLTPLSRLG
jgi:hypothetical protein